jgi:hypothetical protein
MIVTIGGISVRVTLPEDVSRGPIHAGRRELGSHLTRFLSRGDRYDLDLTIKTVREAPWNEILTDEDDAHMRRIAREIERRFPFTAIHFNSDAEASPSGGERMTARHLAAFDTGHVSVIPHPAFLVTVDHRIGRVDALVKSKKMKTGSRLWYPPSRERWPYAPRTTAPLCSTPPRWPWTAMDIFSSETPAPERAPSLPLLTPDRSSRTTGPGVRVRTGDSPSSRPPFLRSTRAPCPKAGRR